MSNAFYNEILKDVKGLLKDLGKPFQVRSKGAYDETTMTMAAPKVRTVQGIVSDSTMLGQITGISADNDWRGKRVLLLDVTLNPKASDEVNVDGRWFSLQKIQEIKPANVNLLYILDLTL